MHKENSGLVTVRSVGLVLLFFLAVSFFLLVGLGNAYALSTDDVTGEGNEWGGTRILGDKPTRVTWVGTVGAEEQVRQINLSFPVGSEIAESASVELQESSISEGSIHPSINKNVKHTQQLSAEGLRLVFEEGLQANSKINIQISGIVFPDITADQHIAGTYIDANGNTHALGEGKAISVIPNTDLQKFVTWLDAQPLVQDWNSNKFLKTFINPGWALVSLPSLLGGWLVSLGLVALGFPLAIPIGLGISFLRMSKLWILKFISSIYVNVIRGTPLFLQIYIAFMGLPLFVPNLNSYAVAAAVLAINSSAYLAEIFRAGIQSINKGQFEASASLGMSGFQTMFSVIIPQTIRRVIPTMTSEFILLFKDTSLLAAIGVMEMMLFAKNLVAEGGNMTPYVVAAAFYLIVTLPLTRVISVFERKLALSEGRADAEPEKKPKVKRVGLFKTTASSSAEDLDPYAAASPEQHDSR